jgi:hypothetical protein
MKYLHIIAVITFALAISSCNNKKEKKDFTISGKVKNASDQQVYLDRIYFSDVAPEVLDTANVKDGQFELTGEASEEGLFRLRFQQSEKVFFLINDGSHISFSGNLTGNDISDYSFSGATNNKLKTLLAGVDKRQQELMKTNEALNAIQKSGNDSLIDAQTSLFVSQADNFKKFIIHSIDSIDNPTICMFALGFTTGMEPSELKEPIAGLKKRFPKHEGIQLLAEQYKKMIEIQEKAAAGPTIGSVAPDFTINDENGKPFTLSSLRGKYVLIDFWASWCGPCRRENPNVVQAYNRFKDKNFEILGVSLDEDKIDWLNAIRRDKLAWKQLCEFNGWKTSAVSLYRFEGIPFNVLLDPEGKILATGLRGEKLQEKLDSLLP